MSTVLITILGRTQSQGNYKKTPYTFPDGSVSDPVVFFGWELWSRNQPDKTIVLGTSGSMWDNLIEPFADSDVEQYDFLNEAVKVQSVTQAQIDYFAEKLSHIHRRQVIFQLISDAVSPSQQISILESIEPLIDKGDEVIVDLTHGFRHIAVLILMAVVILRSVKRVRIRAIYSSFHDTESGVTNVFDLAGLLSILDWQSALYSFNKDGDPGVFAKLLADDGLDEDTQRKLKDASFLGRVLQHNNAWVAERTVANQLGQVKGISKLFVPYLQEHLARREDNPRAHRLTRIARRHLEYGSFDRAAMLGLSAAQAAFAKENESLEKVHNELIQDSRGDNQVRSAYHRLNAIRNAIAHTGNNWANREVNKLLKSEVDLRQEFDRIFSILFSGI